jgi:hypothetical protein
MTAAMALGKHLLSVGASALDLPALNGDLLAQMVITDDPQVHDFETDNPRSDSAFSCCKR